MSAQTKSLEDVFLELTSNDESVSVNTSGNTANSSDGSDESNESEDNKPGSSTNATNDQYGSSTEPTESDNDSVESGITDQADSALTEGGEE